MKSQNTNQNMWQWIQLHGVSIYRGYCDDGYITYCRKNGSAASGETLEEACKALAKQKRNNWYLWKGAENEN